MFPGDFAAATPDKAAIVMATTGETITYAELDAEANRLSRLFRAAGLQPGDHIAFCLENQAHFLPVMWGAHYAGLYYTAMSSRLTTEEMAYIVGDCGAQAFITSSYKADQAAQLRDQMPAVKVRLMVGGTVDGYESYEDAIAQQAPAPLDEEREEGQDMLYSSGTTGQPKGVKVAMLDAPLGQGNDGVTTLASLLFGATADTVYLSPAPLYHAAPMRFCRAVHRTGGTVIVMEHFDPEQYLALIQEHRVTFSQVVPTMFIRLLKLPAEVRARYDTSSLQAVVHAAAPCPVAVKQQMIEWFGPVIHEYYAGTEGNGFVYCNSEDWLAHPGTVGRAIIGTLHIVGDDGEEQPVGEPGTVYFEGEAAATFEYHNDPAKTEGSRDPKGRGWSTLGDVGRLDEDGFLYLTDRKAYMIITGGVNVYPQEAENVLAMHPKVADVAVFGVPNEDFGEEVKAVVQPMSMDDAGPELERELIAYCKEHLADVKCPRSVDFRDELPRHPTGKLYKRLLKDEYWADAGRTI
ncbi:MAG TPA: AMP-binding protein [Acidimicrobiales bacterium]|nr:AMP-binding protein [Acidimicrobiales bacterium]